MVIGINNSEENINLKYKTNNLNIDQTLKLFTALSYVENVPKFIYEDFFSKF